MFCAASLEASNGDVEGIPNTLKEAMATGIPVISTIHAGIPEFITNNKDGILVRENDVDELAEALEFMLNEQRIYGKHIPFLHVKKLNNTLILHQTALYFKLNIMMNC